MTRGELKRRPQVHGEAIQRHLLAGRIYRNEGPGSALRGAGRV